MRTSATVLCMALLVLLLLPCRQAMGADFPPELVKRVQAATVMVYVCDPSGNVVRQGSGFLFRTEAHVITNYHVLGEAAMAKIRTADGREYGVKAILAESKNDDLIEALVDIPSGTVRHLMPAATLPKPGDPVMVIGSPLGVEKAVSQGNVSVIQELPRYGKAVVHSAHSFPGSSGSPLVNAAGDVIGIESAGVAGKPDINLAVPLERFSGMQSNFRQLRAAQTVTATAVPMDAEQDAFRNDMRLAESGDPAVQVRLGGRYELGRGTAPNCFGALNWYRKAASQGFTPAEFHVGRMYYDGKCTGNNFPEAAKWLRKAADKGYPEAQKMLGTMYFNGEGVARDKINACTWMMLASQRNAEAGRMLQLFVAEMSPAEVKSAEDKARSWKPAK